jgi:hypothetical protein
VPVSDPHLVVTNFQAVSRLNRAGNAGVVFSSSSSTETLVQTAFYANGSFIVRTAWTDSDASTRLCVAGDLNRDGLADLVVERPSQLDPLQILVNAGPGSFRWPTAISSAYASDAHYALADLDGDASDDLLAFSQSVPSAVWWPQNACRDWLNNAEGIDIAEPEVGVWHSEVLAHSLFTDAQPGAVVFTGALEKACRLTIQNPTGAYTPSVTSFYAPGATVTLSAPALVNQSESVRSVSRGWTLETSTQTLQGLNTPAPFTLDSDSTFTWHWSPQYLLTTQADPPEGGSVSPLKIWVEEGRSASFLALPKSGWHLTCWNGLPEASQNPFLSPPATQPETIRACFEVTPGAPLFFPSDWDRASHDALRFLLAQQHPTTGLLDSYSGDGTACAELADQAIALIALTHEAPTSPSLALAAERLAQALIAAQIPPNPAGAPADARYWPCAWDAENAQPLDSTLRTEPNAWAAYALLYFAATLESDTAPQARQAATAFARTALACLRRPNGFDFAETDAATPRYSPAPNQLLCWLLWSIGGLDRYPDPETQAPRPLDWWAGHLYQTLMVPNTYRQSFFGCWQSDQTLSTSAQAYGALITYYAGQPDLARQTLKYLLGWDNALFHLEYNYETAFHGLRNLTGLEDATLYGALPPDSVTTLRAIPQPPQNSSEQTIWNIGAAQVICALQAVENAPSAGDLFNSLLAQQYPSANQRAWPQSAETFSDSVGAHHGPQEWGLHVGATAWTYCAIHTVQGDRIPFDPTLRRYVLRLNTNGGNVQVTPTRDAYLPGATVQLQALPTPGHPFLGWGGDASGSENPLEITLDRDLDITAFFYANWAGWRLY